MSACVYIPVQNSEEEVRVVLDQLPRDASDIVDILKAEQAPLDLWLIIAREYFKQGKIEQFRQILEEGSSPEIDEYYADVRYERIAILNALGAYHTYLGKIETKQRERDDNFVLATQYYNRASRIDVHEPSTWIGKGQLCVAKGDLAQASSQFSIALNEDQNNVAALLGQACVEFNVGENEEQYQKALESYKRSLDYYKRALRAYPNCPGVTRLGIGYCRYRLGQFDKARQAFQRVLDLDPENIEALMALGIMELQTNEADGIKKGMAKMQRAFEIYPYCSMGLNHLANHFFFTGQHFLVEQLTETALSVSNHGLMKSYSYYNLARSYHSKGDFEKAGRYYMAAVKEINKPQEFALPFYGLGQVQLKLGDLKNALSNFEKVQEVYPENCETLKVVAHIHVQFGQTEKALEIFRKATRVDPKDAQAFMELGELLMPTDPGATLDALKSALNILKRGGEEVPVELLNNIGVLYFEKGEFELAEQTFKEALGEGAYLSFLFERTKCLTVDCNAYNGQYWDLTIFHQLEENGISLEFTWDKITTLFNYARLLEQQRNSERASILYRLILFKYPDYIDAYLRLAAMGKGRRNIQLSIEMIHEALKIDDKCPNALTMLGDLELKSDDWVKAKDTFRAARDATNGKDSYSTLSLGNWNYFAAMRSEKRGPKLEATHLEKAKELYTKVLMLCPANLYAANGAGVILAEKGRFDVSKDVFTQVQEAASGSIFVQMADVWINLAHVYFAQGHFALAVKMYQNCLRKFYYNTDSQVLLYLARTHYEAEQWQDCKKTLLRAIHLAPSNYTLRFDAGVAMQKFSASTLQKSKRTADEVRATVTELKNAVRVFSQLSAASSFHSHGFDEKKIRTHVEYCKHLLDAAKVHCEAAEREEQQNRQRLEVARQVSLAEEAKRKAEEQRKYQLERRKQEDELKRVIQQEENFERIKEQWKNYTNTSGGKRKDRSHFEDEDGGNGERKRRKGGKRRKKDKRKDHYEQEVDMEDEQEEMDEDDAKQMNGRDEEMVRDNHLAAAGLEDSDAEDDMGESAINRKRKAWSESDEDDEPTERIRNPSPDGYRDSAGSDEEPRGNGRGTQIDENDDY
ncbi:protein CTR9 homolog isoform X1 [Phalaenopsis equestris]|uniref:protein CTR9 homolog isoform X1 n=1 Tax=Phalaenopsis equestris TaxID=78828 RepID=UPI0009E3AAFC|nr:protein CTR9 homolog isoform X1 [Phalaenopsis equestris]XP_020579434.1 protein CTR9 homolog isoform X1 [Phalaenopsis equestris]